MELIASIHDNVLLNVEQAQKQQKKIYAARRGKHLFEGLTAGQTMVKMKKPGKKRALTASWEGPTNSSDIHMERVTSILKKVVDYASSKMPMVTSGRDLVETSKSFMLHQIR